VSLSYIVLCLLLIPAAVTDLLKATPEEAIMRRDIYDRPPIFKWADGALCAEKLIEVCPYRCCCVLLIALLCVLLIVLLIALLCVLIWARGA
jgi:hypothetical protein